MSLCVGPTNTSWTAIVGALLLAAATTFCTLNMWWWWLWEEKLDFIDRPTLIVWKWKQ